MLKCIAEGHLNYIKNQERVRRTSNVEIAEDPQVGI